MLYIRNCHVTIVEKSVSGRQISLRFAFKCLVTFGRLFVSIAHTSVTDFPSLSENHLTTRIRCFRNSKGTKLGEMQLF